MTAVTFHASDADYTAASRDAYLASFRRPRTLIRLLILLLVVLTLLALWSWGIGSDVGADLPFYFTCLVIAVPIGIAINLLWLPYKVRRMFRQQPAYAEPMGCRWSDERFGMTTPLSTIDVRWDQLYGWHETSKSMLFYITDFQVIFVPKRVLQPAERDALRSVLDHRVPRR